MPLWLSSTKHWNTSQNCFFLQSIQNQWHWNSNKSLPHFQYQGYQKQNYALTFNSQLANWTSTIYCSYVKEARFPHFLDQSFIQVNCGILSKSFLRSTFLLNLWNLSLESTKKEKFLNILRMCHFLFLNVLIPNW